MTRALIFGAGGVGSVYGWFLEKAGVAVTAVCRSNYQQVKNQGIQIRSRKWGKHVSKPTAVPSVAAAREYGPFDYIFVCSKAFPETHTLIKDAVTQESVIVLAQNGIGIEEDYVKAYPGNTVISGVVYLPVKQIEAGVVEHLTPLECFEISTYPAKSSDMAKSQAQRLADTFAAGGATCKVYDDIQPQRWNKLAINATFNSMCALSLCDDGNFLRSSEGAENMIRDVMREISRLASALGYDSVTDDVIEWHLDRMRDRLVTGGKEPSMLQDVKNAKPIEVEAILGNAVRIAAEAKVEVPYLRLLYTLAKGLNFSTSRNGSWKPLARVS